MTNISDDECVAVKYVFENEHGKTFAECSTQERDEIIKAKIVGCCEYVGETGEWHLSDSDYLRLNGIYRAQKPASTPNEVDWSQAPKRFKYCFTGHHDKVGIFTTDLPLQRTANMRDYLASIGEYLTVLDGEQGFKRGTVESIDSLLVRPLGSNRFETSLLMRSPLSRSSTTGSISHVPELFVELRVPYFGRQGSNRL